MQRGRATKKTTTEANASWRRSTQRLEDVGGAGSIVIESMRYRPHYR
jgi:hypothetical protein